MFFLTWQRHALTPLTPLVTYFGSITHSRPTGFSRRSRDEVVNVSVWWCDHRGGAELKVGQRRHAAYILRMSESHRIFFVCYQREDHISSVFYCCLFDVDFTAGYIRYKEILSWLPYVSENCSVYNHTVLLPFD